MSTPNRKAVVDCALYIQCIAPYVDGELDPGHAVDMEAHVVACAPCAERVALIRAMRHSLKRRCSARATDALRARIGATLCQERKREAELQRAEARIAEEPMGPRLIRLRYAIGVAAAAGIVFAMAMSRHIKEIARAPGEKGAPEVAAAAVSLDAMIDDLISLHSNPFPPETTNPEDLPRFDPLLGVKVNRPAFQPFGASFSGARLHSLTPATRRAAMLQLLYTMRGGHRVTMYVFNPSAVSVKPTRLAPRLEPEKRVVYVGSFSGYSIAAGEQRGVGYAIASDLGDEENMRMALAAVQ